MGLDMFAFTTPTTPRAAVDFDVDDRREIAYWRKHPDLHGWMEALYRAKGGAEEMFNCVNVALDAADLDALEAAIRAGRLPSTSGPFYGQSDGSEADDDLAFIERARDAIADGETVFYSSWW